MSRGRRVSRVGGLAVIAYLGVAVATGQGVASADPTDSDTSSSSADSTANTSTGSGANSSAPEADPTPQASISDATDSEDSDSPASDSPASEQDPRSGIVQSSGGALTSGTADDEEPVAADPVEVVTATPSERSVVPTTVTERPGHSRFAVNEPVNPSPVHEDEQPQAPVTAVARSAQRTVVTSSPVDSVAPVALSRVTNQLQAVTPAAVTPTRAPANMITAFLAAVGFAPLAAGGPAAPAAPPPTLWAVLAWVRRQVQVTFFNRNPTASPIQTGQTATGVITGTVGAVDPDGDRLLYKVTQGPTKGTVVVRADGTYTYTPNTALAAAGGRDTFTVQVDDNTTFHIHVAGSTGKISVPITVTVNAPPKVVIPPTVGTPNATTGAVTGSLNTVDPEGRPLTYTVTAAPTNGTVTVTTAGVYTYTPTTAARFKAALPAATPPALARAAGEANTDTFSVTATDGVSSTVVTVTAPIGAASLNPAFAIPTGDRPVEIAVGPDGRVYIPSTTDQTISVFDPATNETTTLPSRPGPGPVAVSPDGGLLYVITGQTTGATVATVSKVRTADNVTVGQIQIQNYREGDIVLSQNGTRLYVATDSGVTVINTFNQSIVAEIPVTGEQTGIGITPDGTRLYVTGAFRNTVSVIDTATNTVVKTIAVGPVPSYGIAFTPDGRRAYVTVLGGTPTPGTVSVLDTDPTSATYNTVIATVTTAFFPYGAVASLDGSVVYVVNGSGSLSIIETATNTVIRNIALGRGTDAPHIALSPDGNTVYVTASSRDQVLAYTVGAPTRDTVVDTIKVPDSPFNLAVNPIDKSVWVTSLQSGLTVLGSDRSVTNYASAVPSAYDVDITPDGRFAYVTSFAESKVYVFDATTRILVTTITVPDRGIAQFVDVSPDGRFAYVSIDGTTGPGTVNNVTVIDTATNTIVASVPKQASSPVTVSPDSAFLYLTDFSNGTVVQVSTATRTVTKTLSVPGNPQFVTVSLDGTTLYTELSGSNPDGSTSPKLAVVDVATGASTIIPLMGAESYQPVLSTDGSRLYVPMSDRRSIAVIDTATKSLVSVIVESGDNPRGLAVSDDGHYLYVANFNDDTVSVVFIA